VRQTSRCALPRGDRAVAGHWPGLPLLRQREELDACARRRWRAARSPLRRALAPENAAGKVPPAGVAPVVRFRNPDSGEVSWNDLVKGPISIANGELDDLVIARGAELVRPTTSPWWSTTSTWRSRTCCAATTRQQHAAADQHLRALGAKLPAFGHLPMILGPDGQKLSKRHGAVSVMQYDEDGILPEALFNYLARLGWSHGDDEKFSRGQLVECSTSTT